MKIVDVRTILLSYRYPEELRPRVANGRLLGKNAALVEIQTDEGIAGLCEIGAGAFFPELVPVLVSRFRGMLVGEDPLNVERLWAKMFYGSLYWGRRGGALSAISGIESALWDIAGKAYGVPVYQLLGGLYHERLRVYAAIIGFQPDELQSGLTELVNRGFSAIKLRIGVLHPAAEPRRGSYDLEADREMVAAARAVVGPNVELMVDASQNESPTAWSASTAIKVCRMLEEYDVSWLEEPCGEEDWDGWAQVAAAVDLPIVGGGSMSTRFEARTMLDRRAVDILQVDAIQAGGLLECKKIAALASTYSVPLTPHIWWTGAGMMANLHFAASTPEVLITEYPTSLFPLREGLLVEPVSFKDGHVRIPQVPGLGIQLPEGTEELYTYRPGRLWTTESE